MSARVFGFLPGEVYRSLSSPEWRERTHAAHVMLDKLQQLEGGQVERVSRHLAKVAAVATNLLGDPKFKVAITGLHIVQALVQLYGRRLGPYLSILIPQLAAELGGKHVVFVSAIVRVFHELMDVVSPSAIVALLVEFLETDPAARVVERVLNLVLTALLSFPDASYDFDDMLRPLVRVLDVDGAPLGEPPYTRSGSLVLEVLALAYTDSGSALVDAMRRILSSDRAVQALRRLIVDTPLPVLSADGLVEHKAGLSRSSSAASMASMASAVSRSSRASRAPSSRTSRVSAEDSVSIVGHDDDAAAWHAAQPKSPSLSESMRARRRARHDTRDARDTRDAYDGSRSVPSRPSSGQSYAARHASRKSQAPPSIARPVSDEHVYDQRHRDNIRQARTESNARGRHRSSSLASSRSSHRDDRGYRDRSTERRGYNGNSSNGGSTADGPDGGTPWYAESVSHRMKSRSTATATTRYDAPAEQQSSIRSRSTQRPPDVTPLRMTPERNSRREDPSILRTSSTRQVQDSRSSRRPNRGRGTGTGTGPNTVDGSTYTPTERRRRARSARSSIVDPYGLDGGDDDDGNYNNNNGRVNERDNGPPSSRSSFMAAAAAGRSTKSESPSVASSTPRSVRRKGPRSAPRSRSVAKTSLIHRKAHERRLSIASSVAESEYETAAVESPSPSRHSSYASRHSRSFRSSSGRSPQSPALAMADSTGTIASTVSSGSTVSVVSSQSSQRSRGGSSTRAGVSAKSPSSSSGGMSPSSSVKSRAPRRKSRTSSILSTATLASGTAVRIENAEQTPTDELVPVSGDVESALEQALVDGLSDEWETAFLALEMLRRIVVHSPDLVAHDSDSMHRLVTVAKAGMSNLRSSVSRAALLLVENMFTFLGKPINVHVAALVPDLVRKAGEKSAFMQEQVLSTLAAVVAGASIARAVAALCPETKNKNKLIRAALAHAFTKLIETKGARVFRTRDVASFLAALVGQLGDRDSVVRGHAKATVRACFDASPDFADVAARHLTSSQVSSLKGVVSK